MGIFEAESYVSLLVYFGVLATVIFAFVNSLLYSAESYEAAGKLTIKSGLFSFIILILLGLYSETAFFIA